MSKGSPPCSGASVALGAIGGGVSAGLAGTPLAKIGGLRGAAENAAVSSALTQGIGVLTGVQHSFSWRDVAISAVASSAGYTVGNYVQGIVPRSAAEFAGRSQERSIRGASSRMCSAMPLATPSQIWRRRHSPILRCICTAVR
jgi:hypothetical protein